MRLAFLLSLLALVLNAQTVLLINSSENVEKYNQTIKAFEKNFNKPFKMINIDKMKAKEIRDYLYDEYPDIVYAVGAKSYQYTYRYIPEKKIFFSSIVNWKRLPTDSNQFGISNELYGGMQLTLIKSIFSGIKSIGVIYSQYTKDIVDELKTNAVKLGIKLVSQKVTKETVNKVDFNKFLQQTEALIVISDPVLLSNQNVVESIFKTSQKLNKPIFAYHRLFIKYGATLAITVDNPTIGRQMATIITNALNNKKIQNIQYPVGTKVIFNKKVVNQLQIPYSQNIVFLANEIIE